ncbi:MAG: hypothetical protein HHJ15_18125 [Rhodoferax sp.]|uniref:hypothetical protein n=1 Tax=Rhodoferax sp. TaxID=50421 RepID=UPI00182790AC|nr:hypothetical protein [Rhodoferax sp.]NMM21840.1 hypothetical protein [Rhodoferax sp.]
MADLSDIADALRDTISAALYPSGTAQASSTGFPVQVYQGWPNPDKLDIDLKAGIAHVSVWPTPTERPGIDHFPDWQTLSVLATTITATVSGQDVTIGGTVGAAQSVAIVADGKAFAYTMQGVDTLVTVAAALAAGLTATGITASSAGAVVTLALAKKISVRTGGTGTSIRELRRQDRVFEISCWAWAPNKRDALSMVVDAALGANWRIALPDGTYGNVTYKGSSQHDEAQKQLVYRRDVLYCVEYATTQTRTDAQVLIEAVSLQAAVVTTTPTLTNF